MEIYHQRKQHFNDEAAKWQQKFGSVSWLRLAVFLAGIGGAWLAYRSTENAGLATGVSLFFLILFFAMMQWHNRIGYRRDQFRFLSQINHEEILRLEGKFKPENTGQYYQSPQHPYTGDLDIFGLHSLFVLLNRTQTVIGSDFLAGWLQNHATKEEILERQAAVSELGGNLDWRQQFQATGRHQNAPQPPKGEQGKTPLPVGEGPGVGFFAPPLGVGGRFSWLFVLASRVLPFVMLLAIVLSNATESVTYHVPLVLGFLNLGLVGLAGKRIKQLTNQAYETAKSLRQYADLLVVMENHPFQSERLLRLKTILLSNNQKASAKIERLAGISGNLLSAGNAFFGPLANALMLWSLFWAIRLERWHAANQHDLPRWLNALAEMETLNSLAGFRHANPEYAFPQLTENSIFLEAQTLGHPLITAEKRVVNSFSLAGRGRTIIVTGSNMSGKSTFLRTVGINAVLAMAGAPVCATAMQLSVFQVFTSMRTQDSLEESVSSFYAELQRLKQLLELLPSGGPVFYLLDEILKGTNSQDRHEGAKALIRQLHRHHASGLISTHDLALGEMAAELPDAVKNFSFNSEVIDNQLFFDYKLQPGPCRSFNASKLMQQIGIEMNSPPTAPASPQKGGEF